MSVWAYNCTIVQDGSIKSLFSNDFLFVGKDAFLVTTSIATSNVPAFLI